MSVSAEYLRSVLRVEPDGSLYWKVRVGPRGIPGSRAGHNAGRGRTKVTVRGRGVYAHRVVFAIVHGFMPDFVDHINGDPSDNRPENLRAATRSENAKNRRVNKLSKTGIKGISWHGPARLWRAVVTHNGQRHSLGYFKTAEAASSAWNAAAAKLHGKFFRPSVVPPGWVPPPECERAP